MTGTRDRSRASGWPRMAGTALAPSPQRAVARVEAGLPA
jgi:hypothetical protein